MANREMFQKIYEIIKTDPLKLDMSYWYQESEDWAEEVENNGDWDHYYYDINTDKHEMIPASECGTTRCAAGWAVHLKAEELGLDVSRGLAHIREGVANAFGLSAYASYAALGMAILDLSVREADDLFYSSDEHGANMIKDYAEGIRG